MYWAWEMGMLFIVAAFYLELRDKSVFIVMGEELLVQIVSLFVGVWYFGNLFIQLGVNCRTNVVRDDYHFHISFCAHLGISVR